MSDDARPVESDDSTTMQLELKFKTESGELAALTKDDIASLELRDGNLCVNGRLPDSSQLNIPLSDVEHLAVADGDTYQIGPGGALEKNE